MDQLSLLKGRGKLILQISKLNLRRSMISLVGIIIAVTMVSSTIIYLDSTKNAYYYDYFDDPEFDEQIFLTNTYFMKNNLTKSFVSDTSKTFNDLIIDYEVNDLIIEVDYPYTVELKERVNFLNSSSRYSIITILYDETILEDCILGSSLPNDTNEVILCIPDNFSISLYENFNVSSYHYHNENKLWYNFTLKPTAIINSSSMRSTSPLQSFRLDFLANYYIIMPLDQFIEKANNINAIMRNYGLEYQTCFYYIFNHSIVTIQNVNVVTDKLVTFTRYIDRFVNNELGDSAYLKIRWKYDLHTKINDFNKFFDNFLSLSLPAFIIVLLLVNFSLGIINEEREKSIVLYKMRGISSSFIFTTLSVELLLLGTLSSVLGLIIGIPTSHIINTTSGFLQFDFTIEPMIMIINSNTVYYAFLFGLILTYLSNFRSIRKFSKASINTLVEESSLKKKRKLGLLRQNLDVFLLGQGLLGIIIILALIEILKGVNMYSEVTLDIFYPIIVVLLLLSSLCLLLGFVLSYNRLVPLILNKISKIFWKRDIKSISIATRNLLVKIKFTSRVTLLITLGISFLIIYSSLPVSFNQHDVDTAYYTSGTDIYIETDSLQSNSEFLHNFTNELETKANLTTAKVTKMNFREKNTGRNNIRVMTIDENFSKVAYWMHNYAKQSLEELTTILMKSKEELPIIIDSFSAQKEKLSVGDKYNLELEDTDEPLSMKIVAIVDFWPSLITRWIDSYRYLISTHLAFSNLLPHSSYHSYTWCKIPAYIDENLAIETARNISISYNIGSWDFGTAQNLIEIEPNSLESNLSWIITNYNFLVALIALLIVTFLFTITRMSSQTTEVGLSRALGMKYKQIFLIVLMEPFWLFLISFIPGSILGLLLLISFTYLKNSQMTMDPPFNLQFNIPSIVLVISSILLMTCISGLLVSYRATRKRISKILKVE